MRNVSALWSGWLGTVGACLTCVGSMATLFAGLFGATAMGATMTSHQMAGMSGMATSSGSFSGTGLLAVVSQFSWPILVLSVMLLAWGAWHASGTVKWLVGAGAVVLIMDEILMKALHVMVLWLYVPALLLLIVGNLWAVRERSVRLAETSAPIR